MTSLFKRILAIGLGLSALILIALIWLLFTNQPPLLPENNPTSNTVTTEEGEEAANNSSEAIAYEDLEWRTNSRGKKWALASNDSDFVVSSKDDGGIRFWEGNISPLKVAPGMTQNMKIVVSSPNGIDSVTAMIETDNGTTTVELKKTGVLAARDLDERHGLYTVDENNILAINTTEEAAAYRLALAQAEEGNGPVNAALAASGEREIFEGSWEVKDTSVRDYITIFVARDSAGQEKRNTLSWSDPCYNGSTGLFWPNGGDATLSVGNNCSLSTTYGVDNGNLTLSGSVELTLQSGAVLAFNPGKQINMGLGAIITLLPGASIQKKYLWAQDNDYDNYAVNSQRWLSTSPTVIAQADEGWMSRFFSFFTPAQAQTGNVVRQSTIVSTEDDCYDNNANAFPGQTNYISGQRGDGSYDYDCNGSVTRKWGAPWQELGQALPQEQVFLRLCSDNSIVWLNDEFTPWADAVSCGPVECDGPINGNAYQKIRDASSPVTGSCTAYSTMLEGVEGQIGLFSR